MKYLILIVAIFALSFSDSLGQNKSFLNAERSLNKNSLPIAKVLSSVDTLGDNLLTSDSLALYPSVSGGYVAGNNGFGDRAKAQSFKNDTVFGVTKVLFLFGAKKYGGNAESALRVRLYKSNGLGNTSKGIYQPGAPKDVLSEKFLPLSAISTTGFSEISFDFWSCMVDTNFAVGFDFDPVIAGDSVGLYTGYMGQADSSEMAWELLNTGVWATLFRTWPLDADLAIFPVIDYTYTGISEAKSEKKSTVSPSPASSLVSVIPFKKGNNWKLFLSDISGKIVFRTETNWAEKATIEVDKFPSGIYTLTNVVDGIATQEKLVIE